MDNNLPAPKGATVNITPGQQPEGQQSAGQLSSGLDPVWLLLEDKRSLATRRAYRSDLVDFFISFGPGGDPAPDVVRAFVG